MRRLERSSSLRRGLAVTGVILGILLILYALFAKRSDEELIRDHVRHLAELVSFSTSRDALRRGLVLKEGIEELFAVGAVAEIPDLGGAHTGREELLEVGLASAELARSVHLSFSSVDVRLDPPRTGALVRAQATLHVIAQEGEDEWMDRIVRFTLAKANGRWQITRLQVLPEDESME